MLNPRDRETLRKYLLSNTKVKQLNPRIITFLDHNFGDYVFINGVRVSASEQQKLRLKSKIITELGSEFLQPIVADADRIATAKIHNNEKEARISPEQNYLQVVQQSGIISAAGLTTSLPNGVSVRVNIASLDMQMLENIIVVENLQAFDYWYLAKLPLQLSSALAVYRGHDNTAKSVLQLLQKTFSIHNVVAFMDFDPKGLNMALTLPKVTHILLPDLTYVEPSMSQMSLYIKQSAYLTKLQHNPNWYQYPFVKALLDNKLAVVQETMLARNLPMTLFKL